MGDRGGPTGPAINLSGVSSIYMSRTNTALILTKPRNAIGHHSSREKMLPKEHWGHCGKFDNLGRRFRKQIENRCRRTRCSSTRIREDA